MTTFLSDTFTDTEGTTLTSHTGETGATWTLHTSFTDGPAEIASNRLRPTTINKTVIAYASGTPGSADYYVEAELEVLSGAGGIYSGVVGRVDTAAATFYEVYHQTDNDRWELRKRVAGTTTGLGSNYSETLSTGNTRTVRLDMVGTSIKVYIDGVERISATDGAITSAGKAGVLYFWSTTPSDTIGIQHRSITAVDGGSSDVTIVAPPMSADASSADLNASLLYEVPLLEATGVMPTPTLDGATEAGGGSQSNRMMLGVG